jgi:prolyl-tRNA synthetase
MLWSKLFIPTLRDNPAEAEVVSHQLLLRAGYIRQLSAGVYSHLFLAQRSLLKIIKIVREEMDAIGAQEFLLPALNPAELWQESGRWDVMGHDMFRLKDRYQRDMCLAMTHEEVMTSIARGELRSYKQLPQIWYQIQTKFRDEPRPKSGLMRVRQFIMKDSYTFDIDAAGLDIAYQKHYDAYCKIFSRCGLNYIAAQAHSGAMGGNESTEFMVASPAGEDFVVVCPHCRYAANVEKAISRLHPLAPDSEEELEPEEFHTPGFKTIDEVSAFTKLPPTSQMKSLVMVADGQPVLALMRGDHQLSETKFSSAMQVREVRPAHPAEIIEWFGAAPGSLGPIGVKNMTVIADLALEGRRNMIAGANKDDYHLRNVTPGKHFTPRYVDIRAVAEGDLCAVCGVGTLEMKKAIEVGHIFKLGYKYSESMGLRVLNAEGGEVTPIMGSYGIGIERILTTAIEEHNDKDGIKLPPAIAPFTVVITPVNYTYPDQKKAADEIYQACLARGLDALLDDREDRPGVKFKDADLIGIPYRITVGKKLPQGLVELVNRRTRESVDVPIEEAASRVG